MAISNFIEIQGLVKITKLDSNNKVLGQYTIKNKINNKLKVALGKLICKAPGIDRNQYYIEEMRIYGVLDSNKLSNIPSPTADDNFPNIPADRDGVIIKTLSSGQLASMANQTPGTNLFSAVVNANDKLGNNSTYYISDIVLAGRTSANEYELWSRVLAPADGSPIGLLKTSSVSYMIDWYIIFNLQ